MQSTLALVVKNRTSLKELEPLQSQQNKQVSNVVHGKTMMQFYVSKNSELETNLTSGIDAVLGVYKFSMHV